MRLSAEERDEIAQEVIDGESPTVVARRHGVSRGSVLSWAGDLELRREAKEAELEEARRRAERALVGGPGEVVLLEVETSLGRTLVMADVGRGRRATGTVRRLAGAPLASGAPDARVVRRWAVEAHDLARAVAAAVSNDPEARVTQAQAMRAMTGGER